MANEIRVELAEQIEELGRNYEDNMDIKFKMKR